MKIAVFILLILYNLSSAAQNTIVTDSILQLSTCAGGNVIIPYTATGSFSSDNDFIAQLSNNFGQFTDPVNIGSVPLDLGFILGTIPENTNFGFLYKIRVISTSPDVIGEPCPNFLLVTQVAELNQIIAFPNDTVCEGEQITLTVLNPAPSYNWSNGDTTQSITLDEAGEYSVQIIDYLTCQSQAVISVAVIDCSSELNENYNATEFKIFPNPVLDRISLQNSLFNQKLYYQLYNTIGSIVSQGYLHQNNLDVSALPAGFYSFYVISGGNRYYSKFIKE